MQSILIPHQDKQRRVRDGSEKSPRGRSLFPSVQRDRNSERSRAPFLSSPPPIPCGVEHPTHPPTIAPREK